MRAVHSIDITTTTPNVLVVECVEQALASLAAAIPDPLPEHPHPRTVRLFIIARSGSHLATPEELAQLPPPKGISPLDLSTIMAASKSVRVGNVRSEQEFIDATPPHWHAIKRGWPDFLMVSDQGHLAAVEVKKTRGRVLKTLQIAVLRMLSRAGIPAFRWSPATGYDRIGITDPSEAM